MIVVITIISIVFFIATITFYIKIWDAACRIIEDSDHAKKSQLNGERISRLYISGDTDEARKLFTTALCGIFRQLAEKYDESTAVARIDKQIELYEKELNLLGLTLPPHMENGKAFLAAYRDMTDIRTHL